MSSAHTNPFYITRTGILVAKTCIKCGLLLDAKWYGRYEGHYRTECRKCAADRRSEPKTVPRSLYHQQCQQASLPTAHRKGTPLTDEDHAVMANPDLTTLEKAIHLQRTYYSVNTTCHRLGYVSRTRDPLDPTSDQWVIQFPEGTPQHV